MKDITIDCAHAATQAELHQLFAQMLDLPDYYGANLDALHDCLTDLPGDTRIRLLHWDAAEEALGRYGRSAKRAILDAALDNPNLAIVFD